MGRYYHGSGSPLPAPEVSHARSCSDGKPSRSEPFGTDCGSGRAERLVVKKLAREASLLMDPAAVRYDAFLREHTAIEARVPDHHIARYLGITPEALSRLRRARRSSAGAARATAKVVKCSQVELAELARRKRILARDQIAVAYRERGAWKRGAVLIAMRFEAGADTALTRFLAHHERLDE